MNQSQKKLNKAVNAILKTIKEIPKKIFLFFKNHRILTHLMLMFLVSIILILFAIRWMDSYTNHGVEVVVPEVKGFNIDEAMPILQQQTLSCQIIDSIYSQDLRPGVITEQFPRPGSSVKGNKDIYVIINSYSPRKIVYPEITDISFRQASAMLESLGFPTPDLEYTQSKYKDLVISTKLGEREVKAGDRYPVTTKFTLVVGGGMDYVEKDSVLVEINDFFEEL